VVSSSNGLQRKLSDIVVVEAMPAKASKLILVFNNRLNLRWLLASEFELEEWVKHVPNSSGHLEAYLPKLATIRVVLRVIFAFDDIFCRK
jgi:hypothetical protein